MKTIFGGWLSVLFPTQELENQSQVRQPPPVQPSRKHRQVPREEWIEEESTYVDNTQTEFDQSEQVQQPNNKNQFDNRKPNPNKIRSRY